MLKRLRTSLAHADAHAHIREAALRSSTPSAVMPNMDLVTSLVEGCQQLASDHSETELEVKCLKRKLECAQQQLEAVRERTAHVEKKLLDEQSFRVRYDMMKTGAKKHLTEEQFEKVYKKARGEANEIQKESKKAMEKAQAEEKKKSDELQSKCDADVSALKRSAKSGAGKIPAMFLAGKGKGGKGAGKKPKDPNAPPKVTVKSAYVRYLADPAVKKVWQEGLADKSHTEKNMFKWGGPLWKALSAEEKKPYQDAEAADKAALKAGGGSGSSKSKGKAAASDDDADDAGDSDDDTKKSKKKKKSSNGAANGKAKATADSDSDDEGAANGKNSDAEAGGNTEAEDEGDEDNGGGSADGGDSDDDGGAAPADSDDDDDK